MIFMLRTLCSGGSKGRPHGQSPQLRSGVDLLPLHKNLLRKINRVNDRETERLTKEEGSKEKKEGTFFFVVFFSTTSSRSGAKNAVVGRFSADD